MIKAEYSRNGHEHILLVRGHAGYSKRGTDIVCAAVSGIVYSLLGWLENNSEYTDYVNAEVDDGNVKITCIGGVRAAVALEVTAIGLEQIADRYPDYVDIIITGLAG